MEFNVKREPFKGEIGFYQSGIDGACSTTNFTGFAPVTGSGTWGRKPISTLPKDLGSGGFAFVSFIDDIYSYTVYQEMCKKYKLVFQSPVRPNRYHPERNGFFLCFFSEADREDVTAIEPKWGFEK